MSDHDAHLYHITSYARLVATPLSSSPRLSGQLLPDLSDVPRQLRQPRLDGLEPRPLLQRLESPHLQSVKSRQRYVS